MQDFSFTGLKIQYFGGYVFHSFKKGAQNLFGGGGMVTAGQFMAQPSTSDSIYLPYQGNATKHIFTLLGPALTITKCPSTMNWQSIHQKVP